MTMSDPNYMRALNLPQCMSNKLYLPDTASIYLAIVGNYVFYTWKGPPIIHYFIGLKLMVILIFIASN